MDHIDNILGALVDVMDAFLQIAHGWTLAVGAAGLLALSLTFPALGIGLMTLAAVLALNRKRYWL